MSEHGNVGKWCEEVIDTEGGCKIARNVFERKKFEKEEDEEGEIKKGDERKRSSGTGGYSWRLSGR